MKIGFAALLCLLALWPLAAPCQMLPPPPAAFSDATKAAARKRVQTLTIHSDALARDVKYNLLLPRDYENGGRFSVLYLLHGSYDDQNAWNAKSGAAAYLSMLPLIVVMPDAGMTRYVNSPGYGRYEDFFQQELVAYIDKSYRTIARREGRALCGLSMGGYGAWRLGLDAPQNFVASAALSGSFEWGEAGFAPSRYRERALTVYGGEGPEQAKLLEADRLWPHVAKNLAADGKWQGPALYFCIGSSDPLLESNRLMRKRLEDAKIPFVSAEYPGAHEWIFWDTHLRDALAFLMLHLAPPEK